ADARHRGDYDADALQNFRRVLCRRLRKNLRLAAFADGELADHADLVVHWHVAVQEQGDVLIRRDEARGYDVRTDHRDREHPVEPWDHQIVAHLVVILEDDLDLLAMLGGELPRLERKNFAFARVLAAGL